MLNITYLKVQNYQVNFKNNTIMKTKKGVSRNGNYFTYEVNGKEYWVQGELYYNKDKSRFEHVHIGVRGGETLIFWKENN